MAQDPLKPLIRGMLAMILIVAAVFAVYALRQVVLDEQKRSEANREASKAMQQNRRQEREAADLRARRQREEAAGQSKEVAQARSRDRAALDALQAKKRPVDVGAAFGKLRRKAEDGDPDAQSLMGFIFLHGMSKVLSVDPLTYGVTASTPHASALIGEDIGPRLFDTRFESIPLIPANRTHGMHWYDRAARQGHRDAQASLAVADIGNTTPFEGYRWALIATLTPWPNDYVSRDGHTQDSMLRCRTLLEQGLSAGNKAAARRQAAEFKPIKEDYAQFR